MAILEQKYIIPPFSVFDTRQGYWQKRKKYWSEFGLYSDNGRCNALGESKNVAEGTKTGFNTIAVNTSKFDPVLSEVIYKWFCVKNSCILDPFAGGGNTWRGCGNIRTYISWI